MKPFSRRPEKRDEDRRRSVSLALGTVFLGVTLLPGTMVLATPQYFERAGAGVSALPLQVTAFADPKFGDVADAVNLATGNVYADLGGVNRNNTLSPTDDSKNTFGNFHVNGVQRLNGFNSFSPVQPAEWALGKGDGSFENYTRVANNSTSAACIDNRAEVVGIGKSGTGSGKVEVHVLNGANNYQSFLRQQASSMVPDGTGAYRMADWDKDGLPDLVKIKRGSTASGKTELTILSAASSYQTAVVQSATVLGQTDGNWDFQMADFNGDGTLDLIGMPRNNTGSGTIEAHVMNGANNFQSFLYQSRTGFPQMDGASLTHHWADVDGDGKLDMIGVYKGATASGRVEVQVASGASGYQTLGPRIVTPWSTSTSDWVYNFSIVDWNKDGKPDLMGVSKDPSGSSAIAAVHVLDGNTNFQTALLDTTTPLGFGATDFILRGNDYAQGCTAQSYNLATAPSWINERYAAMQGQVSFYVSKPQASTQVEESWLVTYKLPSGRTVAQVYDHDGNRTTFYANGEYADSTQTLSQQYRSAKYKGDADGLVADSPKTAFSYTGLNNGHLAKVRDEWGRSTVYSWDEATGTLGVIRMLLQDENNIESYVRDVEYAYGIVGGQRVVTYMAFRTLNGQKQWIGRWLALNYVVGANGAVLLSGVTRSAISNSYAGDIPVPIKTTYTYDGQNRVATVSEPGLPDTTFTYGTSLASEGAGGLRMTKTQGAGLGLPAKIETLNFTPEGWLRSRSVRMSNNIDTEYQLFTNYWYDASGHLVASYKPSGAQMQYTYDSRGNKLTETVYATAVSWAASPPPGYVRNTVTTYDNDNQVTNITDEARSGTVDGDAAYAYGKVTRPQPRGYYSQTTGSQVLRSLSFHNDDRAVNDAWVGATNDFFDEQGRLTIHRTHAAGQPTKVTTYTYKDGSVNNRVIYSDVNGGWINEERVRSYGDQISSANIDGVQKYFDYNQFGDLAYLVEPQAFVGKWSGGTFSTRLRETVKTYNGFGQQTFNNVLTQDGAGTPGSYNWNESKQYWQYYSTGELDSSWEGSPSNVTDYRYYGANDGGNAGRLAAVVKGSGGGGGVTTPHGTATLTYDLYGRVNASTTDGFTTSNAYDTLDRAVRITRPDGSVRSTWYDATGQVSKRRLVDTTGRTDTSVDIHDPLGRTVSSSTPDGLISYFYDPFDRPVKTVDDRLFMNTAGNDRATYIKYDEFGHLLKKLSPAMVTAMTYMDARRPYMELSYDNFGRPVTETKLLSGGVVSPSNMVMPTGASTATNYVQYDTFDQPIRSVDPAGYSTDRQYDNDGNVVGTTRQAWTGNESNYAVASPGFTSIRTYAAFDGMHHPVLNIDARGNARKTYFDPLGNTTQLVDQRGIVTRVNWYTADGLLDSVWEPKLDGAAAPTDGSFNYGGAGFTASMVATTQNLYNAGRVYPSTVNQAIMNSGAAGSLNTTAYTYDYAGRPLTMVLPKDQNGVAATVSKTYDSLGNVTKETDANGFTTNRSYDWSGRLVSEDELARVGNTNDTNAGLAGGLHSTYTYTPLGDPYVKVEHGLKSVHIYNTLGQQIAESRPVLPTSTNYLWKYATYRLDGLRTAQTSFDYTGNLTSKTDVILAGDPNITVNSGNITLMEYNARGDQRAELSYGTGHTNESAWWQWVNGLGQRYQRVFTGSPNIYAEQRTGDGLKLGHANYMSFWRADQNGNLIEKWDTPMDGGNWTPRNLADKQNYFSYSYSPSNKEAAQTQNVQVRVQSTYANNTLWNEGGSNGLLLAASINSVTSSYTPRDELAVVTIVNQAPVIGAGTAKQSGFGASTTVSSTYNYYVDGRVQQSSVAGKGTRTSVYDNRGREITVSAPGGTTNTVLQGDGTRSVTVSDPNSGAVMYTNTQRPTIGGLTSYATTIKNGVSSSTSMVYDATGRPVSATGVNAGVSAVQTSSYNEFKQLLDITQGSTAVYRATYDAASVNLTGETKTDPVSGASTIYRYALDSVGHQLTVTGGSFDGASKRYNAEDQTAQLNIMVASSCSFWSGCNGNANRYNDFRYDPTGQQVLTSVGGVAEGQASNEYDVARDVSSIVRIDGQEQAVFRRAGHYLHQYKYFFGCGSNCYTDVLDPGGSNTYTANGMQQTDATYSLLVGHRDAMLWTGIAPFALPRTGTRTLEAPVVPLSGKLRVNPASVTATSGIAARLPDPSKVTNDKATETPAVSEAPNTTSPATTTGVAPTTPASGSTTFSAPVGSINAQSSSATVGTLSSVDPSKVVSEAPMPNTKQSAMKSVSNFAAEVSPGFKDATGFKYPVYAQNVRPLGIMTLEPGEGGGSVNTDIENAGVRTDVTEAVQTGDLSIQDEIGVNSAQREAEEAPDPPSNSRQPSLQEYGDEIAASPDISNNGKTSALDDVGQTYVPPEDDISPSGDSKGHGRAIPTDPLADQPDASYEPGGNYQGEGGGGAYLSDGSYIGFVAAPNKNGADEERNILGQGGGSIPFGGPASSTGLGGRGVTGGGGSGSRGSTGTSGSTGRGTGSSRVSGGRPVDARIDSTGKVHGDLPNVKDLNEYNTGELKQLLGELKTSVQTRIDATVRLGANEGHNARLAAEQQLIKSIEKNLGNR